MLWLWQWWSYGEILSLCEESRKGNIQAQPNGPNSEDPKRNLFYALKARGEQDSSPYVVTGMLKVFFVNVYAFLYPGATLSFITPLVARNFDVLPEVLIEPFSVYTKMGDFLVAKVSRVTLVDLV